MPSLLSTSSPPAHPIFRCFLFAGHLKIDQECTNAGQHNSRRRFIPDRYECTERWDCGWTRSHWPRAWTGNSCWIRRRGYSPSTPEAEGKIRGVLLLSFAFMESLCIYGLVIHAPDVVGDEPTRSGIAARARPMQYMPDKQSITMQ